MRHRLAIATSLIGPCASLALISLLPASAVANPTQCPNPSELVRPLHPRGAIQAAKAFSYGHKGRVLAVTRGPASPYADSARRLCGAEVVTNSIYVEVHPAGMRCAACNFHGYLVKYRRGPWKVWTNF